MRFDKRDKVVKAPNGLNNPLYKLTKAVVKVAQIKNSLVGTKEEVLAKAAKMNEKSRHDDPPPVKYLIPQNSNQQMNEKH